MIEQKPQPALLADELDRRSRLDAAIAACAQRFAETHDLYEILRASVDIIRDHIGMDRVGIFLYDAESNRFTGSTGTDETGALRDERELVLTVETLAPAQRVLRGEGDEFFYANFHDEFPWDGVMQGVGNLFFLGMRAHGRLLGAISADNLLTGVPIDGQTRESLRRFARYIALAIENHRLVQELEGKNAELEVELRKSKELVRERDRMNKDLQEFAYIVSHDLKAPLRGISSLAQWLEEDCGEQLDSGAREKLGLLVDRTRRMHGMIEGILRYSRVGASKAEMARVDAGVSARGAIDLLSPPEGVRVTVEPGMPVIPFDPVQLEQVFQNLVGNALAHMGRADGSVRVSCSPGKGEHLFCVEDDGVGIEPRHFERIFRVFQTLRPGGENGSSGIGLAVVKKIVEAHGGRVWVESEPGRGARFYFTVPRPPGEGADGASGVAA